jgi:KDO2-lipid IV(A) lauroyltransferase
VQKVPLTQFMGPRYWPTWLGLGIMRALSFLPLPIIAALGKALGLTVYALAASRRRISFRNISVCFPELTAQEVRRINRAHFGLLGHSVFSTPRHWWVSERRFVNSVTVVGKEHYDDALATGRNIIILAPHFVALDVAGYILARERPILTMYQYAKNRLIDEVVKRGRTRYGGELVERKEPMRNLIRAIRKGHPFYYLPDQDAGRKGVFVPFFHEQASTYPMLGKFTQMTNALVVPCRTRIKPWGRGYEVCLGKPLDNYPLGDELSDTARMNEEVAELIRPYPEQYFWVHKRFKTRPPEDVDSAMKFYN